MEDGSDSLGGIKKAVVVLTRLPDYKISALRPPTPQQFYSEDDSLSSSDSDMQWEPDDDSSDSDFSLSNNKKKTGKHAKTGSTRSRNNNNGNANMNTTSLTEENTKMIATHIMTISKRDFIRSYVIP